MSSRPFFLLPLCFVSALALNAYAALDPTGVYQDYLEKLDAATPPVAAMATAAADGVYPWSEPKAARTSSRPRPRSASGPGTGARTGARTGRARLPLHHGGRELL